MSIQLYNTFGKDQPTPDATAVSDTVIDPKAEQEQITLQVLEGKNPTLDIKTEEIKPIPTPPPLSEEALATPTHNFQTDIETYEKTQNLVQPATPPETTQIDEKPQGLLNRLSSAANGRVEINESTSIKYGVFEGVEVEYTF